MAMEKITITMTVSDLDLFERGRVKQSKNMSKSAYVRLLIAEHEERVPPFIKYKEIIEKISELNVLIKTLILSEKINDVYKIRILEEMADVKAELSRIAGK